MIRPINSGDMQQLVGLFHALHGKTLYNRFKPCYATALQKVSYLQATPSGFVRVAEHDGKLTGFIACICEEFWWTEQRTGARYATDLAFYSQHLGDGTKMLKEAIEWAWSRPRVVCFETANSSGIEHKMAARMYERAGLKLEGSFWRVNHPKLSEK